MTKRAQTHRPTHENISRALSWVLRHGAVESNLPIRSDGYVCLEQLLLLPCLKALSATVGQIRDAVHQSSKQRYQIEWIDGAEHIRAVQGHTISAVTEDDLLTLVTKDMSGLPRFLVHATFEDKLTLIVETGGLHRMSRNHIHFFDPYNPLVGRSDATMELLIDYRRAIGDGIEFWQANNGVYLTSGLDGMIPIKYVVRCWNKRKRCTQPLMPSSAEAPATSSQTLLGRQRPPLAGMAGQQFESVAGPSSSSASQPAPANTGSGDAAMLEWQRAFEAQPEVHDDKVDKDKRRGVSGKAPNYRTRSRP